MYNASMSGMMERKNGVGGVEVGGCSPLLTGSGLSVVSTTTSIGVGRWYSK